MDNKMDSITSDWLVVTQEMINDFGNVILDYDPMHMDPDFAKDGPYGGTIAFGFLTLSLLMHFMNNATGRKGTEDFSNGHYLNYGFDRLRFVSPVRVNSRVRGVFTPMDEEIDERGRMRRRYDCRVEIEGENRPALVGEWLSIQMLPATAECATR